MPKSPERQTIDRQTIRSFWTAGKAHRTGFVLSWLSPLTTVGLGVAIPYFIGRILGSLAIPGSNINHYVVLLVVTCAITLIFNKITFETFLKWQPKVMADLQTSALHSLMRRGLGFHNNQVSGKIVSDALDYPSAFSQLSSVFIIDIIPFLLVMVVGISLVTISSPLIGVVLLAMTLLVVLMTARFRRRMAPFRYQRQLATKAVTAHLADTIVNAATVAAFGNENHEQKNHAKLSHTLLQSRLHDWGEVAKDGNYRIFGLLSFEILFVLVIIHEVQQQPALLATGIFAFSYTITLTNRLFQIGTMMRSVEEALLLAAPMTELLQQTAEIIDKTGASALHIAGGRIDLHDVGFKYPESSGTDEVFTGLNFAIEPGEKIGLVGPSGGGKSTLTKLLLRFEDIDTGSITIDGQNISAVQQVSLRKAIGYVPQEPLLFHRSVRDNITYGNLGASDEDIRAAAKKAYALDFIETLPDGFDTIVGERGVKLSGGQRQRIAIARAILKDAPILLLDEATSALDSESEQVIQKALQKLMEGRTTLVIAHRLSTIQKMDRIIVLSQGQIVETGSHQQLVKADGLYARLWQHQSGGFIEE